MAQCNPIFRPIEEKDEAQIGWHLFLYYVRDALSFGDVWGKHFLPGQKYLTLCLAVQLTLFIATWLGVVESAWLLRTGIVLVAVPPVSTTLFKFFLIGQSAFGNEGQLFTTYTQEGCMGTVVECCGGKIVGFVLVKKDNEEEGSAELVHVFVKASHRRQGLGRRLCACAEEFSVAQSYKNIFLYSMDRFRPAHRLYKQIGYTITEEVELPPLWGVLRLLNIFKFRKALLKTD